MQKSDVNVIAGKPFQSLKNLPRIRDRPMHRVQKPDLDPGDIYARCAETCPRSKGHLCPVCRNMNRIQGTFMHGVQKHAPARKARASCP